MIPGLCLTPLQGGIHLHLTMERAVGLILTSQHFSLDLYENLGHKN